MDASGNFSTSPFLRQAPSACQHQYGFLPCAENVAGYAFLIVVYQGLLMWGEDQIGIGTKVLFTIYGVGKVGGIIFRILMSLPSLMLMVVSGVVGSRDDAQNLVSLIVGIFAGVTVFSLTVQWGLCVISAGRNSEPTATTTSCSPKNIPRFGGQEGVKIDELTRSAARIILISLIPYLVVRFGNAFTSDSEGNRTVILIALILSLFFLISYFVYQVMNPWVQQRSLEYTKYEIQQVGFMRRAQKLFNMIDQDDDKQVTKEEMEAYVLRFINDKKMKVNERAVVSEILKLFDLDADGSCIVLEELTEKLKILSKKSGKSGSTSRKIVLELLHQFEDKKEKDPQEIDRKAVKILRRAETTLLRSNSVNRCDPGKPRLGKIRSRSWQNSYRPPPLLSPIKPPLPRLYPPPSPSPHEPLLSPIKPPLPRPYPPPSPSPHEPLLSPTIYEDIDEDLVRAFEEDEDHANHETEFVEGLTEWVKEAIRVSTAQDNNGMRLPTFKYVWVVSISVIRITVGFLVLTFLGGPMIVNILQLSSTMNFPTFIFSFVIVPFTMNVRATVIALLPASKKNRRAASLTFSEIYGGVFMNNIAGLTVLLIIVYAKDLIWDFSAEVSVVMFVCAVMGTLASYLTTYRPWTCILAILLYPFSLGLYYFTTVVMGWN